MIGLLRLDGALSRGRPGMSGIVTLEPAKIDRPDGSREVPAA
jgi:hypothetical protein